MKMIGVKAMPMAGSGDRGLCGRNFVIVLAALDYNSHNMIQMVAKEMQIACFPS